MTREHTIHFITWLSLSYYGHKQMGEIRYYSMKPRARQSKLDLGFIIICLYYLTSSTCDNDRQIVYDTNWSLRNIRSDVCCYLFDFIGSVLWRNWSRVLVQSFGHNFILLSNTPCIHVLSAAILLHLLGNDWVDRLQSQQQTKQSHTGDTVEDIHSTYYQQSATSDSNNSRNLQCFDTIS